MQLFTGGKMRNRSLQLWTILLFRNHWSLEQSSVHPVLYALPNMEKYAGDYALMSYEVCTIDRYLQFYFTNLVTSHFYRLPHTFLFKRMYEQV